MTLMFLFVIMGATDRRPIPTGLVVKEVPGEEERRMPPGFGPIPIGLVLTLIHLISIPVTNTSVNPARSTGPALFVGGWAIGQLWLFWIAPIVGATLGALLYRGLTAEPE